MKHEQCKAAGILHIHPDRSGLAVWTLENGEWAFLKQGPGGHPHTHLEPIHPYTRPAVDGEIPLCTWYQKVAVKHMLWLVLGMLESPC